MSISVRNVLFLVSTASLVNSFNLSFPSQPTLKNVGKKVGNIPSTFHIRPGLDKLAEKQKDVQLQLHLDIGINNENKFTIRDTVLELQGEEEETMLPGAKGMWKSISSQRRSMKLIKPGSFISMTGQQQIDMLRPSWELVWPTETPSGSLVMGFSLPQDYSRNEHSTTFTSGNISIQFPIWSKSSLKFSQAERHRLVAEFNRLYESKKKALDLYNECHFNPVEKVLHFRDVITIHEKLERVFNALRVAGPDISSEEEEFNKKMVMKLKDDLYVTKVGYIYRQNENSDGGHKYEKIGSVHLVNSLSSSEDKIDSALSSTITTPGRRWLSP